MSRFVAYRALIALACGAGIALAFAPPLTASAYDNPYRRIPNIGEAVRLDGSVGGVSKAWAYYQQADLESYLRITIDGAADKASYDEMQDALGDVAHKVVSIGNGTRASVEEIEPYDYRGRNDVEVRVIVDEGNLQGRDVWTTLGELTDNSGQTFVRR